jgi:hypothetical protein
MEWQSYIALGIVAITLVIFAFRLFFKKKSKKSCGHGCGCAANEKQ